MDLNKMGKFIATIRKEQGMTQEQLGKKLGVLGKSVSKWERGVNAPDIGLLEELSNVLGITINELLKGEKIEINVEELEKIKKTESETTIDGIKFYSNRIKNKSFKYMLIVFIVMILAFSLFLTINNYNKCQIYSISADSSELNIEGYFIFNQSQEIIIIDNINYIDMYTGTNKEPLVKKAEIQLLSGDKMILTHYVESNNEINKTLSSFLNKINVNIDEKGDNKENLLGKKDLDNLELLIKYTDIQDNEHTLKYQIKTKKEFSNNKLFY